VVRWGVKRLLESGKRPKLRASVIAGYIIVSWPGDFAKIIFKNSVTSNI